MASSEEFLRYVLDQIKIPDVTYRQMMGEYILYYTDKMIAYVCDDRLLLKPIPVAESLLPDAKREPPYEGAKAMLVVENLDDSDFLTKLFEEIIPHISKRKNSK